MAGQCQHWTEDEIAILRKHAKEPTDVFAHLLAPRSIAGINRKRYDLKLGYTQPRAVEWLPEEDAIILAHPQACAGWLLTLLTRHSKSAIVRRRQKLLPNQPRTLVERRARESAGRVSSKAAEFRAAPRPIVPPAGSITNGPSGIRREWFADGSCLPYLDCLGPRAAGASDVLPVVDALARHLGEPVAVSG